MPATIYALASGAVPAAIAVIRIAGPETFPAIRALLGGRLPSPRRASLRKLRDPETKALLDTALVLTFPGPESFTGDDGAELHLHGGPAVVAGVLQVLAALPGLRQAEPGEFTRRAFDNDRIDLTQAEALADLLSAETAVQRDVALANAGGRLRRAVEAWREPLLHLLADAEADLDFYEAEDDVRATLERSRATIEPVLRGIEAALATADAGERIRSGLTVAIVGPPNSGKSSLLNALAQREIAIVTPHPGTTRDVIEAHFDFGGVPVTILDTAGLRESTDPIESEGIARARARAAKADLLLATADHETDRPTWRISTKVDLQPAPPNSIGISAVTSEGIEDLRQRITAWATQQTAGFPLITQARHRSTLAQIATALHAATSELDQVLRTEWLREAVGAMGQMTGQVPYDMLLGSIFQRFCVGK